MRAFACSMFLALCLAIPAHAATPHEADVAAIQQIVEQFKGAIIARDGDALGKLFLQDQDSWLSVHDDSLWRDVKGRNPAAKKIVPSSWKTFAAMIKDSPRAMEERFYNVRIDTNGAVAAVWFEFDFLVDGKVGNRGSESWQMVRAEDGWKISSMLFSMGR